MNNGIIITVNLPGRLEGRVSHTETQTVRVQKQKPGQRPYWTNKTILHSDRKETTCYKRTRINEETVNDWVTGSAPFWIRPRDWTRLTRNQKIEAYVVRFDEGYGVSHEIV